MYFPRLHALGHRQGDKCSFRSPGFMYLFSIAISDSRVKSAVYKLVQQSWAQVHVQQSRVHVLVQQSRIIDLFSSPRSMTCSTVSGTYISSAILRTLGLLYTWSAVRDHVLVQQSGRCVQYMFSSLGFMDCTSYSSAQVSCAVQCTCTWSRRLISQSMRHDYLFASPGDPYTCSAVT